MNDDFITDSEERDDWVCCLAVMGMFESISFFILDSCYDEKKFKTVCEAYNRAARVNRGWLTEYIRKKYEND